MNVNKNCTDCIVNCAGFSDQSHANVSWQLIIITGACREWIKGHTGVSRDGQLDLFSDLLTSATRSAPRRHATNRQRGTWTSKKFAPLPAHKTSTLLRHADFCIHQGPLQSSVIPVMFFSVSVSLRPTV